MYRDNSLIPSEAIRLLALGILAGGEKSYADLASEVRHFVKRTLKRVENTAKSFYAVADESDRNHGAARSVFEARAAAGDLVTSDYVFVESWCLLRARLGRTAAIRFWDAMQTGVVRVFGVTSADVVHARRIVADWPDQEFSLVDCTSFALMERLHFDEALAFDAHFRTYRHGPGRKLAFRVFH